MHFSSDTEARNPFFKCDYCDFVGKNEGYLQIHRMSHKKCHICGKVFVGKSNSARDFQRHMAAHSKPKRELKCFKCGKTFTKKGNFNRHVKTSKKCNQIQN